jgi:SsrA-binding protein
MKSYAENKKGRFNYEILEEYEAGIILSGPEVKSVRTGQISLREAFATISRGEVWLTNAHISPYKQARDQEQEPTRPRKLLLSKKEIEKLIGKLQTEGITLIPLKVYDKHGKIKVEIGLARGKKKYDKRERIKKRDLNRDVKRDLKEATRRT